MAVCAPRRPCPSCAAWAIVGDTARTLHSLVSLRADDTYLPRPLVEPCAYSLVGGDTIKYGGSLAIPNAQVGRLRIRRAKREMEMEIGNARNGMELEMVLAMS